MTTLELRKLVARHGIADAQVRIARLQANRGPAVVAELTAELAAIGLEMEMEMHGQPDKPRPEGTVKRPSGKIMLRERFTARLIAWFGTDLPAETLALYVNTLLSDVGYAADKKTNDIAAKELKHREYMRHYQRRRRAKEPA